MSFIALACGVAPRPAQSQQTNLPPPSERYPFAKGTLDQLDLGSRRMSLNTPSGRRSFEVTARTYIFRGKEKITLDKLKIGENLRLSYYTNELGQTLVKRIKVDSTGPTNDLASPAEAPR